MHICNKVKETCFEPIGAFKEPCPHATAHDEMRECAFKRCERTSSIIEGTFKDVVFIDHIRID